MKYLATLLLAALNLAAHAQSYCASDGQPQPVALLERFINADCAGCWSDARTPEPVKGGLAVDWIVPGSKGDEAPLSAAAMRDGIWRLESLKRGIPPSTDASVLRPVKDAHKLRVAHGLPVTGYIGASIELQPGTGGPWKAWLLLLETIPAGAEGTLVERNLVRNSLQLEWKAPARGAKAGAFFESRPMNIPEGANPDRMRVAGWVQDAQGRIHAMALSRCMPVKSTS
ncbi:MAG: hypothetical protein H7346_07415 [Burkholderiaceae bacterium]|nr:hypothetical protein [Burkholderiaceae bacterium]